MNTVPGSVPQIGQIKKRRNKLECYLKYILAAVGAAPESGATKSGQSYIDYSPQILA